MTHHHHDGKDPSGTAAGPTPARAPPEEGYSRFHQHMRRTTDLAHAPKIEGFDFEGEFDFARFLSSYQTTGFQASELAKAISITNKMLEDKATVFLSMTGNVISSGLREIVAYLCKHKLVDAILTTASGIEEDAIKALSDFRLGDFDVPGRTLFEYGVGRIGNIFVPNDRYLHLERFMTPLFDKLLIAQEQDKRPATPTGFARAIGLALKDEKSFLFWAARNDIPVYCPGIVDGSMGDLLYFYKNNHPGFHIDVTDDHKKLIDYVLQQEKTGGIVLGGGIAKHYNLNAQIFKDGFDYAVYLTTAMEYDGSDSGGNEEEAKTWAKIKVNAKTVKVKADFTLTFPLLVAGSFALWAKAKDAEKK